MYCEIVERDYTKDRGRIIPVAELKDAPADYERYCSAYYGDKDFAEYVKIQGTVSDYKGKRTARVVWMDIDCKENPQEAYNNMRTIIARLNSQWNISPDDLLIYFSGSKGYHIGLHEKLCGEYGWFTDFGERAKQFVYSLVDQKLVDEKIYDNNRIFRLPNSKNNKSGLYKIPLNYSELDGYSAIYELAKKPRPEFKRNKPISDIIINGELQFKWQLCDGKKEIQKESDQSDFFAPPREGNRNSQLHKQACALFKNSELSVKSIFQIIKSINLASPSPLQEDEIRTIIQSASKGKTDAAQKYDLRTLGEWSQEWYDSILPEKNTLSLLFPSFDNELKGKLRSKLIVIVGAGGTKKSLLAKNIVYKNMAVNDSRAIYSTMEMGAPDTIDRFINLCIEGFDVNPSRFIENENKKFPGMGLQLFKDKISPIYSDRLLITQNTGMQMVDYEKMITETEEKCGRVDFLIPDGLSMMGGSGTETELVNRHTAELKQLSIKKNVCILLIVHVTKQADRFEKDCGKYMRGSNKILDNCDLYLSASLEKDYGDEPTPNIGNIRMVNKRGSGRIIDCPYIFDPVRLLMTEKDNQIDI